MFHNDLWIRDGFFAKYQVFFTIASDLFKYTPNEINKLNNLITTQSSKKERWDYRIHSQGAHYHYGKVLLETDRLRDLDKRLKRWFKKVKLRYELDTDIKEKIDALISGEMLENL